MSPALIALLTEQHAWWSERSANSYKQSHEFKDPKIRSCIQQAAASQSSIARRKLLQILELNNILGVKQ